MQNNENGFMLYFVIALIYAVVLGILLALFNLFGEEKTTTISIIFQSIFFGIFMSLFEYWRNRKKNSNKK